MGAYKGESPALVIEAGDYGAQPRHISDLVTIVSDADAAITLLLGDPAIEFVFVGNTQYNRGEALTLLNGEVRR